MSGPIPGIRIHRRQISRSFAARRRARSRAVICLCTSRQAPSRASRSSCSAGNCAGASSAPSRETSSPFHSAGRHRTSSAGHAPGCTASCACRRGAAAPGASRAVRGCPGSSSPRLGTSRSTIWANPCASLRSVLLACSDSAAFACRAWRHTSGTPNCLRACQCHTANDPVSIPTRVAVGARFFRTPAMATGVDRHLPSHSRRRLRQSHRSRSPSATRPCQRTVPSRPPSGKYSRRDYSM